MVSRFHESARFRNLALLLIFSAALILRVCFVAATTPSLPDDTDSYRAIASNILAGRGFSMDAATPSAYRPPGYPLFLAACRIVADDPMVAIWVQCFLSAMVVLLAALVAQSVVNELFSVIAAIIVAVDPFLIGVAGQFMTETLFAFLTLAAFFLLLRAIRSNRLSRYIAAGLVAGTAALTRPEFLLFVPVALLGVVVWGRRRRRYVATILFLLAAVVPVGAWGVRNKSAIGKWIFTTTHGGYTHLLSYNEVFYGQVVAGHSSTWAASSLSEWQESLALETAGMDEMEKDRFYYQKAGEFVAGDRFGAAHVAAFGALRFWAPFPHSAPGPARICMGAFFIGLLALAIGGTLVVWRRRPSARLIVYLLVIETVVHMYYWSNVRMRIPFHPLLAVLAAAGVAVIFGRRSLIGEALPIKEEESVYSPAV